MECKVALGYHQHILPAAHVPRRRILDDDHARRGAVVGGCLCVQRMDDNSPRRMARDAQAVRADEAGFAALFGCACIAPIFGSERWRLLPSDRVETDPPLDNQSHPLLRSINFVLMISFQLPLFLLLYILILFTLYKPKPCLYDHFLLI